MMSLISTTSRLASPPKLLKRDSLGSSLEHDEQDIAEEVVHDEDRHGSDHDRAGRRHPDPSPAARGVVPLITSNQREGHAEDRALDQPLDEVDRVDEPLEVLDELP